MIAKKTLKVFQKHLVHKNPRKMDLYHAVSSSCGFSNLYMSESFALLFSFTKKKKCHASKVTTCSPEKKLQILHTDVTTDRL